MAVDQTMKSIHSNLRDKKVLVVGMGASGIAAATFLQGIGAVVTVTDQSSSPDKADEIRQLTDRGVKAELGSHNATTFEGADLIVISPGVSTILPELIQAGKKGVPVIGELELASRFIQKPIIAVSGTNGKSTVTSLLGHLLAQSGYRTAVGGNIGTPLVSFVNEINQFDVLVVEVSSFQLDTIDTFQPGISIMLNITPDHLDRYDDFAAYAGSKGRMFENQQKDNIAILNGSDDWVRSISQQISARRWFVSAGKTEEGSNLQGNQLTYKTTHHSGDIDLSQLKLPGNHNRENAAAAVLAAIAFGAEPEKIEAALASFKGLSHRIEWVAEREGVSFYNDSKATNIDAVVRALEAFDAPVVLIMGGRNKGYEFSSLLNWMKDRVRVLIAIGEAAPDILSQLGSSTRSQQAATMEEAVSQAFSAAHSGDVVLLSPGCASFDMFTSYAHRGEVFCSAVKALKK
jgi:UDP-N-acetylmuramoylalanine--D-glutamate ligase